MTDGYLVTRLLNLDVLISEEARRFYLEDELTINFVRLAFLGWALNDWVEFLGVDNLINFKTTSLTSVHCDLHLRSNITCSRHNTSDSD